MATLTETAIFSKKASRWVGAGIIILIVLIILLISGKTIKNMILPPKAPPATVAFGKLPKFDLSLGIKPPTVVSYDLETVSGAFPISLPQSAKVFSIAFPESSFGALEQVKVKASRAGFSSEPVEVLPGSAKFVDNSKKDKVLTIETASGNLVLFSNYLSNPEIITRKTKSVEDAIRIARNFFNNFDLDMEEFPEKNIQTRKLRVDTGGLKETLALSDTNLIEVVFGRADADKLPILAAWEETPQVWAFVSGDEIVAANLKIAKIQKFRFSTYPLKGVQKAYDDLKAQNAAFNKKAAGSQIAIREVTLGYIEGKSTEEFLQPVYLFRGNEGFVAYVAAVAGDWTE